MSAQRQQSRNHRARPSRHLALAAALLSCAGLGACTAAEPPSAAPTADATDAVPLPYDGDLDAGTYLVDTFTTPFEITVPAGWGANEGFLLIKEPTEEPGVFVMFSDPAFVPADACNWSVPLTEIGPSVEAFADALAAAAGTTTTEPREVTVGDFSGVEFDVSVESGVMLADCTEDHVCIHSEVASHCTRYYHESESQNETYRVLDLDGDRAVLAVGEWTAGVDPALVAEARAVFDSIRFLPNE